MLEWIVSHWQLIVGLIGGALTASGVAAVVIVKISKIARTVGQMALTFAEQLEAGGVTGASAKDVKRGIGARTRMFEVSSPLVAQGIKNLAQKLDEKKHDPEPKKSILGVIGRIVFRGALKAATGL